MTTLLDYALEHFPNHGTTHENGERPLADHTVVSHVTGAGEIRRVGAGTRKALTGMEVSEVRLGPTSPTVVPDGGEDKQGVVDLPKRRVLASALVVGVIIGAAVGVVVGVIVDSVAIGFIVGVFAVILGGVAGGMLGGGGRYAGERAWEQHNAPDSTIGLIAVYCKDEAEALQAARTMELMNVDEVRILNHDGAWRSPNT